MHRVVNLVAEDILQVLRPQLCWSRFWTKNLSSVESSPRLHLAIMAPPYFDYVMDGTKTIESRFTKVRCAPYQKVRRGDVILLKPTGRGVLGLAYVETSQFYEIERGDLQFIRKKFGDAIRPASPDFWEDRKSARYASLIGVSNVVNLNAIRVSKKDRRGWVVIE